MSDGKDPTHGGTFIDPATGEVSGIAPVPGTLKTVGDGIAQGSRGYGKTLALRREAARRRTLQSWPHTSDPRYIGGRGPEHLERLLLDDGVGEAYLQALTHLASLMPPPPYRFAIGSGNSMMTAIVAHSLVRDPQTGEVTDEIAIPLADCNPEWFYESPGYLYDHRPVMEYLAAAAEAVPTLVGEIRNCHRRLVLGAVEASDRDVREQSLRAHVVNERAKRLHVLATLSTDLAATDADDAEADWAALGHDERTHWRTLAREALIDEGILTKEGK